MRTRPPEKLDAQAVDLQHRLPFLFLTSLPLAGRGWFANHALLLTRHDAVVCNRGVPRAGLLGWGR